MADLELIISKEVQHATDLVIRRLHGPEESQGEVVNTEDKGSMLYVDSSAIGV